MEKKMKNSSFLLSFLLMATGMVVSETGLADTLPVTSGLYAWYKIDSLDGLSDGQSVDLWVNSSGNTDFDLAPASPTPPTYSEAGFAGGPSVHFSTTSPLGTITNIGLTGDPEFTVIFLGIIIELNGSLTHPWAWGDGSTPALEGGASDFEIEIVGGDFRVDYATGNSRDALTPTDSFTEKLGKPTIVSFRRSPGPLNSKTRIAIDCIEQTITGSDLTPNISDTPFWLGPTANDTKSPTMEVAEVIIFNRDLLDSEMDLLHAYLMSKYYITVLSPNGNEELIAGQVETISWESLDNINDVKIEYSDNNGVGWNVIDANTENDGSYDWTLPQVTSNQCLVRVSDANDANVYDTSDDVFTIYVCQNPPAGDLNGDCCINFLDFAIMVRNWPWCGNPFHAGYPENMVFIGGGEFEMGDHFDEEDVNERPVHPVYVDSFCMGKFEVTNSQYCDYLSAAKTANEIKVDGFIVYAFDDSTNSYLYCDTHGSDTDSQIDYNDVSGTFSVRTKGSRDMSNDPVVQVSWYGSVAYCNWRSQQEGYEACYNLSTWECDFSKNGYRLPTEAEREYAARGGEYSPYYRFPWGDTISHSEANYYAYPSAYPDYDVNPTEGYHPDYNDVEPYTAPVRSFAANGYGLYDMAGNVQEWCNDWYDSNYYNVSPYDNPQGPTSGTYRVLRDGTWQSHAVYSLVATRNGSSPGSRGRGGGFRVVLDLEPIRITRNNET
jgi:formylglycine-generating enzyme required for sulfatase activity